MLMRQSTSSRVIMSRGFLYASDVRLDQNISSPCYNGSMDAEDQEELIKKYQRQRLVYRAGSVVWIVGFALVALYWLQLIPYEFGWCGFGLTLLGAIMQFFSTKRW